MVRSAAALRHAVVSIGSLCYTGAMNAIMLMACGAVIGAAVWAGEDPMKTESMTNTPASAETAMFGGGCFWCIEAVFQRIPGVVRVRSGYAGGHVRNPTYKQVCTGETGHAEVVRVEFEPAKVSYEELLRMFWDAHDPTTLNRQGPDVGTQYRSVIFTYGAAQKAAAEASKAALERSGRYKHPVVTEIVPAPEFYPAEDYHQNYYNENGTAPYCRMMIAPKLKKLGLKP